MADRPLAPTAPAGLNMRIFSGIQPTGSKHLGNYIGAISQYVAAQDLLIAIAAQGQLSADPRAWRTLLNLSAMV